MKRECAVFRDLKEDWQDGMVEAETAEWMAAHQMSCPLCRDWSEKEQNRAEQQPELPIDEKESLELETIKKARRFLAVGIGMIALFLIWVSIWLYI
ncbi:hypothetical protein M3202_06785 [Alkalihalobacillus oceani]|uniref:Zinc-finger domain-containing protein n=1 Tax=Halalkalibacter oceani TaxID=1653776 RepID=A0A9X2DQ26_9BACI|nr:hypothetical protein [Halalkalibacter oceani]MCM3713785.1 hypothetical protein [Halalkalibacter oceani]